MKDILRIAYFRANPNVKTKKPEPTYRVVMSESWRERFGENPVDPLIMAAPGKVFKGFRSTIPDLRKKLAAFPDPPKQVTSFSESVRVVLS